MILKAQRLQAYVLESNRPSEKSERTPPSPPEIALTLAELARNIGRARPEIGQIRGIGPSLAIFEPRIPGNNAEFGSDFKTCFACGNGVPRRENASLALRNTTHPPPPNMLGPFPPPPNRSSESMADVARKRRKRARGRRARGVNRAILPQRRAHLPWVHRANASQDGARAEAADGNLGTRSEAPAELSTLRRRTRPRPRPRARVERRMTRLHRLRCCVSAFASRERAGAEMAGAERGLRTAARTWAVEARRSAMSLEVLGLRLWRSVLATHELLWPSSAKSACTPPPNKNTLP